MANVIRIKRSTGSSAPASLANAELAFAEGSAVLYYGTGTGGAGGSATSIIKIGGSGAYLTLDSTTQSVAGAKTFTGSVTMSGASSVLVPTAAKTDNSTTAASTAYVQSVVADYLPTTGGTISSNLTVSGNLTVQGTTTTVNSTQVDVADKNITLGNVGTPTNTTADGGGISLLGATTKTFSWVNATSAWTSSEHLDLASGKAFYINGTSVLSGSTLGSGVTGSSLTSVGTIGTGIWQGTTIAVAYGGTGATTLTGYVKGNGTSAMTASATIPNTDITGLGTLSTQNANNVAITGGTIDGITLDGGSY